jgi:integrase
MANSSIKIVLRKRPNKDGTRPLILQLIKDRKSFVCHTGTNILEKDWDALRQRVRAFHPEADWINVCLQQKLAEASHKWAGLQETTERVPSKPPAKEAHPSPAATFFVQASLYLEELKTAGKYNQYTADKPRVKHFREFCKGGDFAFSAVTPDLLQRFQSHLTEELNLSERSAMNHWVMIRSVFARARKSGLLDENTYPFGKGRLSIQFPETKKASLTKAEIRKIEEMDLQEPYNHARNLWLLCYYLGGARISDVLQLKWCDFREGRLYLPGTKKKVPAEGINAPGKAAQILEGYKPFQDNTDLVFSDLRSIDPSDAFRVKRQIAFCTSRYDKFLRKHIAEPLGIKIKLTMHVASHAFAQNTG